MSLRIFFFGLYKRISTFLRAIHSWRRRGNNELLLGRIRYFPIPSYLATFYKKEGEKSTTQTLVMVSNDHFHSIRL